MAMCKCRDTGARRCRWEHVSDDLSCLNRVDARLDRKRVRALSLANLLEEEGEHES